jgi:hypothetical protein
MAVFLPYLVSYPMGFFPARLLVISMVAALIELVVGTLAGAWLYKEGPLAVAPTRSAAA